MTAASIVPVFALCTALAACGDSGDRAASGQIGAWVNSKPITVQDIDAALARKRELAAEPGAQARRDVLDALIDQRLAQQGAVERRLDRAPEVLQALEAAKAQVLARAYLEELARTQPDPSAEDVRQYYVAHPELFAERHVFMLEQIDLPRASDIAAALRERAASPGASIEAIADWLRARDVPHSVTRGVRAGDRVPLELLPKLRSMREGELAVIEAGDALLVIRMAAQQPAPLDEATAAPLIAQFLRKRSWERAVQAELRRLRLAARIEYPEVGK